MSGGFLQKFMVKTTIPSLDKDVKGLVPNYKEPEFKVTDDMKENAKQALKEYRYLNKVFPT